MLQPVDAEPPQAQHDHDGGLLHPKHQKHVEMVRLLDGHNEPSQPSHEEHEEPLTWKELLLHKYRNLAGATFILIVTAILIVFVTAQPRHTSSTTWRYHVDTEVISGLGPVWWPQTPSASQEAYGHFSIGLRMLHVFWYDQARVEFQRAVDVEPRWAMGYWGVAMTCKQQLWMTEDVEVAHQALRDMQDKANMADLSNTERQYIQAARALWAPGKSMEQRERAYSTVLADLHHESPDDVDACAFYGLSLLSMTANSAEYLSDAEQEEVLNKARRVLDSCAGRWWDHTGLLHYITHAYDFPDPLVASKGLPAGLHLSEVATAACHAQHMKSHLYLQLGDWHQVVDSNVKSVAASDKFCNKQYSNDGRAVRVCDKDDKYHALEWWLYGLTQQCAWYDARALLGRMVLCSPAHL